MTETSIKRIPVALDVRERLTVRKHHVETVLQLVEFPEGQWRVYRDHGGQADNWALTTGRWFPSRADAIDFLRDKSYIVVEEPKPQVNAIATDSQRPCRSVPETETARQSAAVYRFRAECELDVDELRDVLGSSVRKITLTIEPPFPDVEVELEISLTLEDLRDVMRRVVDGHVMVQTVARREEYTGERDYEL